jgi:polyisoprenoid-binding protein YceI
MKRLSSLTLVLLSAFTLGTTGCRSTSISGATTAKASAFEAVGQPDASMSVATTPEASAPVVARYKLDASQSRFMVRAFAGGLLFFKGHDHFIAVRDFSGEAQLTPGAVSPASLQMTVRADSLVETRDVFTEQQKQIINRELREIVLETARYPEITFKSTDVTGNLNGGQLEAKIGGNLTLHGVTRHIVIPARVTLNGETLSAQGEFTVNRGDYNVKATSALHGTIRIRDKLTFTFDIVAHLTQRT